MKLDQFFKRIDRLFERLRLRAVVEAYNRVSQELQEYMDAKGEYEMDFDRLIEDLLQTQRNVERRVALLETEEGMQDMMDSLGIYKIFSVDNLRKIFNNLYSVAYSKSVPAADRAIKLILRTTTEIECLSRTAQVFMSGYEMNAPKGEEVVS